MPKLSVSLRDAGLPPHKAGTSQLRVRKVLSRDQTRQSVAEQELVLAVVEPELELRQICLKVLGREPMVRADDRPFEQRPCGFDGVGMNIATNPFLGVV